MSPEPDDPPPPSGSAPVPGPSPTDDPSFAAVTETYRRLAEVERAWLRKQALTDTIDRERQQLAELQQQLVREEGDVRALEGLSLRSIVESIRGRKDELLSQERAEVDGLRLEIGVRSEALAQLDQDVAALGSPEREQEGAQAAFQRALEQRQAVLARTDSAQAWELRRLADEAEQLRAERVEVGEAVTVADQAQAALAEAAETMASADDWSTFDTFFGGDMIAGMIKYNKLDQGSAQIARVQHLLSRLNAELADLAQPVAPHFDQPSPTLRTVDLFFDNIFTDLMVRDRIKASAASIDQTTQAIDGVRQRLADIDRQLYQRLMEVEEERRRLLLQDPGASPGASLE